jgi:N-acetylglucosamine-6-phosphate deacetylase
MGPHLTPPKAGNQALAATPVVTPEGIQEVIPEATITAATTVAVATETAKTKTSKEFALRGNSL